MGTKSSDVETIDASAVAPRAEKRVILSMGGKGGVGKTSVMAGLAEWFDANQIPVKLLDLDTENKARGSMTHFFGGHVPLVAHGFLVGRGCGTGVGRGGSRR